MKKRKWYPILLVGLALLLAGSIAACGPPPSSGPPVIVEFAATPTEIDAGESTTLLWNVMRATTVTIDHGIGNVPVAGTKEVSPAATTGYTLTAANTVGTVTRSVVITVTAPPTDSEPPIITNVVVSSITETSAVITWATDEPGTSQVEYGTTTGYGSTTALDEDLVTSHGMTLTSLAGDTTYHFGVKSQDECGNEAKSEDKTFTTLVLQPVYYTLTTHVSGSGSISPADGDYQEGISVALVASPSPNWRFDHWEGDAAGTSSSLTITMDSDKSVTAHFVDTTPPPPPPPSPPTPGVYTNEEYGFSVKYPAEWAEQETTGETTVFSAAAPAKVPALFVCVVDSATFADAVIAALNAVGAVGTTIESESETALADGTPATEAILKTTLSGYGADALTVGAQKDGKWVVVTVATVGLLAKFDEAKFSEIAHSLQFE